MSLLTAPRSADWIGCIDFGTALSKVALVRRIPRAQLSRQDVRPLPIAARAGIRPRNYLLLPSIVFITDDGRILFGDEAQAQRILAERRGREAFVSPKQYLSTRELQELESLLDASIDPTEKYSAGDLLTLFLAHLLEQARSAAAKERLPWPVPLRLARPAWEPVRAEAAEQILQSLLLQAFVIADELGPKLSAQGGVSDEDAFSALTNARDEERLQDPALFRQVFELDSQHSASVLEATAAAAGSIRDAGRRVVVVADIGAGTSDFGAFLTGLPGTDVLTEIRGSSHVLKEAGDHLDALLINFAIDRAGLDIEEPEGRRALRLLRVNARANKEALFSEGTLVVELSDEAVLIRAEEFLADLDVKAFAWRLRLKCHEALVAAVACAKQYSVDTRLPVEILLTGGGHSLPMVKALADHPSVAWIYTAAAPEIPEGEVSQDFMAVRPQLTVAIGGAVRDLPRTIAPGRR